MKIGGLLDLRQVLELLPIQSEWLLHQSMDAELPILGMELRMDTEIQDWPVARLMLPDRKLRHAVAIRFAAALRLSGRRSLGCQFRAMAFKEA